MRQDATLSEMALKNSGGEPIFANNKIYQDFKMKLIIEIVENAIDGNLHGLPLLLTVASLKLSHRNLSN